MNKLALIRNEEKVPLDSENMFTTGSDMFKWLRISQHCAMRKLVCQMMFPPKQIQQTNCEGVRIQRSTSNM